MSTSPKILAFSGSARTGSLNKKLIAVAAKAAAEQGAEVTLIDLADYAAPIYSGDDEAANGLPHSIIALKNLMKNHQGLLIATPEYNGSVPPLLVNTFAWCSRSEEGDTPLIATMGKPVGLMAASPGGLGGVRVIPRLRDFLAELGCVSVSGFAIVPQRSAGFRRRRRAEIRRNHAEGFECR